MSECARCGPPVPEENTPITEAASRLHLLEFRQFGPSGPLMRLKARAHTVQATRRITGEFGFHTLARKLDCN
jgi:hypothetical protein